LKSWDLLAASLRPHSPEILSSSEEARTIVLEIPAGESLADHQVHERAWVTLLEGEAEVTTPEGEQVTGGPGLLLEFSPAERHAIRAIQKTRLLLFLAPWPGEGHPGSMSADEKAHVRERAAQARGGPSE
jgi:mannose-6-phosphate isomerase-like protein (cupin superfamily)